MPVILTCLMLTYAGLDTFIQQRHRKCGSKTYPLKAELAVLGVTLLVYEAVLLMPALRDNMLTMGFGCSVSLIVRLMLVIHCLGSFPCCLCGLQLLLYPYVIVALLLGWTLPGKLVGYQINNLPFTLRIVSPLLAYGPFGIVTLLTVLILLLSHNLHRWRASTLSNFLPPLLSLEELMFHGMLAGFVLLTYSVISGTFFAESVFGKPLTFIHKTIFGILSWLIYDGLLLKHSMTVWHGKKATVWTIIDFASLLLAYVNSKFVLEIVLHQQGRRDGKTIWRA